VIRNNIIWRRPGAVLEPDTGISVWDSPGTRILQNTVILNGTYPFGAIDYRWGSGVVLANNLTDAPIWQRDEARGRELNNVTSAEPDLFVNAALGDLHLASKSQTILHKVPALRDCPMDLDGKIRGEKTDVGAVAFHDRPGTR
jgi:hypothetical protein